MKTFNEMDDIIAFEQGDLSKEQTIELFQRLVDSGLAGRMAETLIESGLVEWKEARK